MEVRITKPIYDAHKELFKSKEFDENHDRWYRDFIRLDLARFPDKALAKLQKAVASTPDIHGCKRLAGDIQNWRDAIKGGKENLPKIRTVKSAEAILRSYIFLHAPRHLLYTRQQLGDEGVTLSYFIDDIEFTEATRDYPSYIDICGKYEERGIILKRVWTFYANDLIGYTAMEVLTNRDLMTETRGMRGDYEQWCEQHFAIKDQVGKQFLAVGVADELDIDGNDDDDDRNWWRSSGDLFRMVRNGEPSRVVVDVHKEEEKDDNARSRVSVNYYFWTNVRSSLRLGKDNEEDEDADEDDDVRAQYHIPIHPFVTIFDLKRHRRLRIHVGNLTEYVYDPAIRERLILPDDIGRLIDALLVEKEASFVDVVRNKSGGIIIICHGPPGTGKTLTGEIYSEHLGRALYSIQCSQLGVNPKTVEKNLMKTLLRGRRWGAVMLLDEADVYVSKRGDDLDKNAIVGVFLRVLEYHTGVLFLTTNRGDSIDDAIMSRCTAAIPYKSPSVELQKRIWLGLAAANKIDLPEKTIDKIVAAHPNLSGRDIKNLLKLGAIVAISRGVKIGPELIGEVQLFKPVSTG